jgi:PAS domain S-box-containing protein
MGTAVTADGLRRHPVDVEWLAAVADASGDPMIVLDEQGTLQYANPITAATLGVDVAEWLGRDAMTLFHPDDLELALASLDAMVDRTSGVGDAVDLRVRADDGSFRSMEMVGLSESTLLGVLSVIA